MDNGSRERKGNGVGWIIDSADNERPSGVEVNGELNEWRITNMENDGKECEKENF